MRLFIRSSVDIRVKHSISCTVQVIQKQVIITPLNIVRTKHRWRTFALFLFFKECVVKSLVHRGVHLQAAAVSPQQTHNNARSSWRRSETKEKRSNQWGLFFFSNFHMLKFLYLIRCDYLKCSSFFCSCVWDHLLTWSAGLPCSCWARSVRGHQQSD